QRDEAATQRILVVGVDDVDDRCLESGQSSVGVMLVERVNGAIIAQQALDDAIALGGGVFGGGQKAGRTGEIGEVGLLQALVGQGFGARGGVIAFTIREIFKELGGFGKAAAIVARIGLG